MNSNEKTFLFPLFIIYIFILRAGRCNACILCTCRWKCGPGGSRSTHSHQKSNIKITLCQLPYQAEALRLSRCHIVSFIPFFTEVYFLQQTMSAALAAQETERVGRPVAVLPLTATDSTTQEHAVQTRVHDACIYQLHQWKTPDLSDFTVLTDADSQRVFAYSPPSQTLLKRDFLERFQDEDVEVRELLEGTMVHLFWQPVLNRWEMATRNGVGGDYAYVHPVFPCDETPPAFASCLHMVFKTFREMVLEALGTAMRRSLGVDVPLADFRDCQTLDLLPKTFSYMCILQHAENHLVYSIAPGRSRLVCTAIHRLELSSAEVHVHAVTEASHPEVWAVANEVFTCSEFVAPASRTVRLSERNQWGTEVFRRSLEPDQYDPLEPFSASTRKNRGMELYPCCWSLVHPATGEKTEVKNDCYQQLHALRNMQPNVRYQCLDLYLKNQLCDYLVAFPQYSALFGAFVQEVDVLARHIHHAYIQYYVQKRRDRIPKKYFVHASKLHHDVYLPTRKQKVTLSVVKDYLSKLSVGALYHAVVQPAAEEAPSTPAEA